MSNSVFDDDDITVGQAYEHTVPLVPFNQQHGTVAQWQEPPAPLKGKEKVIYQTIKAHRHYKINMVWYFLFVAAVLIPVGLAQILPMWGTLLVVAGELVLGGIIKATSDSWD